MQTFLRHFSQDKELSCEVELVGKSELADKYTFPSLQAQIWVYDDGGNIITPYADIRVEIQDYQSVSELTAGFLM